MCQVYHIVAYGNCPDRHIARCEHGALHLAWDYATYHLSQDGLERLLELVLTFKSDAQGLAASGAVVPAFQIWFNNSGLCLTEMELDEMDILLHRTIDGLSTAPQAHSLTASAAFSSRPAQPATPSLN